MLVAYWEIGREVVQEEQRGKARADYGRRVIAEVSRRLTDEFGKGFSERNVEYMRRFHLVYPERRRLAALGTNTSVEIAHTPSAESVSPMLLSWSHYRVLCQVNDERARSFYEIECVKSRWSVRELERQINSLLFERLARSRDREGVLALAREGHEVHTPADFVKDPYVLEFVGLPESARWLESDLEDALINRLQQFLLELGRDLFFVARQKRITIDGDHYYIDLVFYHRVLRCFLIIDLKVGKLTQADIGQMLLYTGYFEAEETREDENPPIGLILCTDHNEAAVRYTLSQSARKVFASRYKLHLPSAEDLACELQRELRTLEEHQP